MEGRRVTVFWLRSGRSQVSHAPMCDPHTHEHMNSTNWTQWATENEEDMKLGGRYIEGMGSQKKALEGGVTKTHCIHS